jgi:hypothetical protein
MNSFGWLAVDLFERKAQSEYYAGIERNSDGRHVRR